MDGLGYALRALGIHPPPGGGLCIEMFETDPRCRRLLELRMASSHCHLSDEADSALVAGSVFWLVEDECRGTRRLLDRYPNLRRVLVVGGSPCVGFSKANTTSRGIDDPESRKLWIFPVLLNYLFLHVQSVFFILENVQMAPTHEDAISSTLGCPPVRLDAASFGPCSRPRLFWTNLPVAQPPPLTVQPSSILDPGWRPLWELCPVPGVAPPPLLPPLLVPSLLAGHQSFLLPSGNSRCSATVSALWSTTLVLPPLISNRYAASLSPRSGSTRLVCATRPRLPFELGGSSLRGSTSRGGIGHFAPSSTTSATRHSASLTTPQSSRTTSPPLTVSSGIVCRPAGTPSPSRCSCSSCSPSPTTCSTARHSRQGLAAPCAPLRHRPSRPSPPLPATQTLAAENHRHRSQRDHRWHAANRPACLGSGLLLGRGSSRHRRGSPVLCRHAGSRQPRPGGCRAPLQAATRASCLTRSRTAVRRFGPPTPARCSLPRYASGTRLVILFAPGVG